MWLDVTPLTKVPRHWAALGNEYFVFLLCMCNESVAVKIFHVTEYGGWPWLAARHLPSSYLASPPQQGRRRKQGEKVMGRGKDRDHLPVIIIGKIDWTWRLIEYIANFLKKKSKIMRNKYKMKTPSPHPRPFSEAQLHSIVPNSSTSSSPKWARKWRMGSCSQSIITPLCCFFLFTFLLLQQKSFPWGTVLL